LIVTEVKKGTALTAMSIIHSKVALYYASTVNMKGEPEFRDDARDQTGNDSDFIRWVNDDESKNWELGGDFSAKLGFLGNFKTLFVVNRREEDENAIRLS
jgi:hypothetical protein